MEKIRNFIAFQKYADTLKHLKRTGWVMSGVSEPETVASHSWRMAVMALQSAQYIKSEGADLMQVLKLCLLHDVAEGVIGDIVPEHHQDAGEKISDIQKEEMEKKASRNLAEEMDFKDILSVFEEYNSGTTKEARIAKDLDKLDMLIQAEAYREKYPSLERLKEFMKWNENAVKLPFYSEVLDEIKKEVKSHD